MSADDLPLLDFDELAFAGGQPAGQARIKQRFEDFQVDEVLGFEPTGSGEHRYLKIRKQDMGTTQVASMLAERLGTDLSSIGYSGMKDRRAVCTQWFSVPDKAAQYLTASDLGSPFVELLETRNNDRKLKIGSHRANRFLLRLRAFSGDFDDLQARIEHVKAAGVPNYFGPQRLGRAMSNVTQAQDYFRTFDETREGIRLSRKKRSMLLSASRSYLFNVILSKRVTDSSWDRLLAGEVLNLDGTGRFFKAQSDQELQSRLAALDIHPTGLLAGKVRDGDPYTASEAVAKLEAAVLSAYPRLCAGLSALGVAAARRSLRLMPRNLEYKFDKNENSVLLSFMLPAGG
ncbi:MAG: tRNA pseudouridine(13) synthase TruD, partial [Gammaproteobacteria bacterium]|nr:tRNA pseudouridine(13) synthase TruD [Gammaproteobacteria bacterium]